MKGRTLRLALRELNLEDSIPLAHMLNTDIELNKRLGNTEITHVSVGHFYNRTREWCRVRSAIPYAIILDDLQVIGLLTLGRPDEINKAARIAYWIESKTWDQGLGAGVLPPVLELAKGKGVRCIVGQTGRDDLPGREVWEKNGAQMTDESEGGCTYEIRLPEQKGE
jgi:RimJ/RimL family protein N-acetyltransferase